jgi:hypothetical protein
VTARGILKSSEPIKMLGYLVIAAATAAVRCHACSSHARALSVEPPHYTHNTTHSLACTGTGHHCTVRAYPRPQLGQLHWGPERMHPTGSRSSGESTCFSLVVLVGFTPHSHVLALSRFAPPPHLLHTGHWCAVQHWLWAHSHCPRRRSRCVVHLSSLVLLTCFEWSPDAPGRTFLLPTTTSSSTNNNTVTHLQMDEGDHIRSSNPNSIPSTNPAPYHPYPYP